MLNIRISGDQQVRNKIHRLGRTLFQMDGAMEEIGKQLVKFYSTQPFLTEGGIYGKPWPALKPSYEQYKVRHYPGRGILQRTFAMQNSFYARSGSSQVVIGNDAPYFLKHQRGEGVPQRLIMAITKSNVVMITETIKHEVKRKLASA